MPLEFKYLQYVSVEIVVSWFMTTSCSLVRGYERFGETCLRLQGGRQRYKVCLKLW